MDQSQQNNTNDVTSFTLMIILKSLKHRLTMIKAILMHRWKQLDALKGIGWSGCQYRAKINRIEQPEILMECREESLVVTNHLNNKCTIACEKATQETLGKGAIIVQN